MNNQAFFTQVIGGVLVCLTILQFVNTAQISDADLLAQTNKDVEHEDERLFEYIKTTSDGVRLGCKGKVSKGTMAKVQSLFIEDSNGRRELRTLAPTTVSMKNFEDNEEDKYVPLRDFPMYCLERVFSSPTTCPPGPQGRTGRDGRNGTAGLPGNQGPQGNNGTSGNNGEVGPQGPTGDAGPQGEQGDRGDVGISGEAGPQGPKGTRGPDGIDGLPGAAGPAGVEGRPGISGVNGVDGTDGDDGIQGPAGLDGLAGIPGPDGVAGVPGISGNNGFNGADGSNGQNGMPGTPGTDGQCCASGPGWNSGTGSGWTPSGSGWSSCHNEEEDPEIGLSAVESTKAEGSSEPIVSSSSPSFWAIGNDVYSTNSGMKSNTKSKPVLDGAPQPQQPVQAAVLKEADESAKSSTETQPGNDPKIEGVAVSKKSEKPTELVTEK